MSGLTDFQVQVARVFFALPESAGFLVAGGAALIAQELIDRETRDLDLFASPRPSVTTAVEAFESALTGHGWTVTRTQDGAQFVRLLVHGAEDLIVDIGVDSAPERTPVMCLLGPSYDPLELAGRKLLALFDRAEAHDFTDIHALANLYGTNPILDMASHLDTGSPRTCSPPPSAPPTDSDRPSSPFPPRTSPTCWPSSPPGASSYWARHSPRTTHPSKDPTSRTPRLTGEARMACTIRCTQRRRRRLGPSLPGDPS